MQNIIKANLVIIFKANTIQLVISLNQIIKLTFALCQVLKIKQLFSLNWELRN